MRQFLALCLLLCPFVLHAQELRQWSESERKIELGRRCLKIFEPAHEKARINGREAFSIRNNRMTISYVDQNQKDHVSGSFEKCNERVEKWEAMVQLRSIYLTRFRTGGIGRIPYYVRIVQIIDFQTMIVKMGGEDCWIKGINTERRVDGQRIDLAKPIEVIGTKQYPTVLGGTRTIWEAKPVDMSATEKKLVDDWNRRDARTWNAKAGGFSTEAILLEIQGTKVVLGRLAGMKRIEVKTDQLSEADQEYVSAWRKRDRELTDEACELLKKYKGKIVAAINHLVPEEMYF